MQELQREASLDPLTGLKNRRRFEEDLRMAMARAVASGRTGAVLMLDLDHFKQVNDSLGHPAGDRLIEEIAACCAGAPARATCWPGSAATSSRSSCPAAASSEARMVGRGDRDGDPRAPARPRRRRADHRQHRRRDVRRRPARPASSRSSPKPTRRCTRPRTAAATACASSTRSRSATRPPGTTSELELARQLVAQVAAPAGPTASNSLAVEGAGAELRHQRPPGPLGRRQVGEEEQVGAGPGRRHARPSPGPPKARTATVSSASVIETPSKPRRRAQLAGGDRRGRRRPGRARSAG